MFHTVTFFPQSLIASVSHLGAEKLTEAAQFPPATAPIYAAVNYVCSDMISNKREKIKQELASLYKIWLSPKYLLWVTRDILVDKAPFAYPS